MIDVIAPFLPDSIKNRAERAAFVLLAGAAALPMLSIAAAQLVLGGAAAFALRYWKEWRPQTTRTPHFVLPLGLFFGWTVPAIVFSPDPRHGAGLLRKFLLFSILFLVPMIFKGKGRILWVYRAVFFIAAISSAVGVFQYIQNPHRDFLHRISGFMSQWMTFSGSLMLVLVALSAYVMCIGLGKSAWTLPLGILIIAALALSLTRNAWMGAIAGLFVVLLAVRPRAIAGLVVILALLLLVSPGKIQDRLRSGFNPSDDNTRNRIELFETSLRLIKAHPWLGVGGNVAREALKFRGTAEFPDWLYQHMHNNILQIAAERGLPGLAFWLWFIAALVADSWKLRAGGARDFKDGRGRPGPNEKLFVAAAALGCCAALLVAGMAEYNFGDSEVLMLFLFIMSAPGAILADSPNPLEERV